MGNICEAFNYCIYNDYEKCPISENITDTVKEQEQQISQFFQNKEDYGYYCLDEEIYF